MSKFVQDIVVQQTCDTLVYRYLVEKGHLRTAKLLKEERKNSYTLTAKKDEKVSEIFSHLIPKYVQMELDSVSSNLVCDYMKKHENPKIQKLALKLKSLVPSIQMTGKNPSIGEILNHAIVSRRILVPISHGRFCRQHPWFLFRVWIRLDNCPASISCELTVILVLFWYVNVLIAQHRHVKLLCLDGKFIWELKDY